MRVFILRQQSVRVEVKYDIQYLNLTFRRRCVRSAAAAA
eukprot:SAG31_NODE_21202_length_555_cov_1.026316_2_plen_38_part_01